MCLCIGSAYRTGGRSRDGDLQVLDIERSVLNATRFSDAMKLRLTLSQSSPFLRQMGNRALLLHFTDERTQIPLLTWLCRVDVCVRGYAQLGDLVSMATR